MLQSSRTRDPVYVHAVGLITAVFFGSLGIAGVGKLFARRPGLKLSEAGIHSSAVAAGFVPWSDVTGARIYTIKRSRMLVVKVRDPEKYIAIGGTVRAWLNRANFNRCGSPIVLSSSLLAVSFDELVRLFHSYLSKYGVDLIRQRDGG